MKKFLSVLLAVMMLLSALPVMAEGTTEEHVCPGTVEFGDHYSCEKHIVETKEATCTEGAYTLYACQAADCDTEFKIYVDGEEGTGHTYEENVTDGSDKGEMTKEPTCTEKGEVTYYCTTCKTNVVEKIDAIGHQWTNPVKTEATCFADGYTTETCSVCGATQKVDIVAKYEHKGTLETKSIVEDATCDAEGDKVTVVIFEHCTRTDKDGNDVCDYESKVDETSMYIENLSDYHQKAMNDLVKATSDKETKQQIADRILAKVEDGLYTFDKVYYVDVKGDETKHEITLNPAKVTYVPATCTTEGTLTMVCIDTDGECTANVTLTIPATGHKYTAEGTDGHQPDCLNDGSVIVRCENGKWEDNKWVSGCKFNEQIKIEAPGAHKFEGTKYYTQVKPFETIERTTDKDAMVACLPYTVETACCGYTYPVELSNGDKFEVKIPGCVDKKGNPVLSAPETVEATEKHVADPDNYAVKKPTCTEAGFEISNCMVCGTTTKTELQPLNHKVNGESAYKYDEKKDVVLPTCTEDGSITWTCELCKDVKVQVVPATGHGWDIDPATGKERKEYSVTVVTKRTCTVDGVYTWNCNYCEATKTVTEKAGHTAPEGTIVSKEATCTTDGSYSFTCEVCHKPVTEIVKALGHTWERTIENGRDELVILPAEYNTTGKTQYYDKYVPATCVKEGYYYRECDDITCKLRDSKTGKNFDEVLTVTEKLPHILVSTEVEKNLILNTSALPTCETAGEASFNCAFCGEYVEFEIPALPHNEVMTWNETKHAYEFTCEKASTAAYFAELKESEYLYNQILACIDAKVENREKIARTKQNEVVTDLQKSLGQKDIVVGVGCKALLNEIKVNKTHYDATIKGNTVTLKAVENCALLDNPWIIVSWAYELSDGTSMTVTMPFKANTTKDKDGKVVNTVLEATIYVPEVDESAKLVQTTVAVTNGASVDLAAAYQAGYGFDKF